MASIQSVRNRMLPVFIVLILLDVAAVAFLLSPVGRSRNARIQEYDRVRNELQAKRRDALPARDMDQKLATARTEIANFYKNRLPSRYSEVTDALGRLAKDSRVQLGQIKYDAPRGTDEPTVPGLEPLAIDAQVTGDYGNLMRFINGLDRDKTLFIVDSVNLGEAQGGSIRLAVKLETYLRTGQ